MVQAQKMPQKGRTPHKKNIFSFNHFALIAREIALFPLFLPVGGLFFTHFCINNEIINCKSGIFLKNLIQPKGKSQY